MYSSLSESVYLYEVRLFNREPPADNTRDFRLTRARIEPGKQLADYVIVLPHYMYIHAPLVDIPDMYIHAPLGDSSRGSRGCHVHLSSDKC